MELIKLLKKNVYLVTIVKSINNEKNIFIIFLFLNSTLTLSNNLEVNAVSGAHGIKTKTIYGTLSGKVQDSDNKTSIAYKTYL